MFRLSQLFDYTNYNLINIFTKVRLLKVILQPFCAKDTTRKSCQLKVKLSVDLILWYHS